MPCSVLGAEDMSVKKKIYNYNETDIQVEGDGK